MGKISSILLEGDFVFRNGLLWPFKKSEKNKICSLLCVAFKDASEKCVVTSKKNQQVFFGHSSVCCCFLLVGGQMLKTKSKFVVCVATFNADCLSFFFFKIYFKFLFFRFFFSTQFWLNRCKKTCLFNRQLFGCQFSATEWSSDARAKLCCSFIYSFFFFFAFVYLFIFFNTRGPNSKSALRPLSGAASDELRWSEKKKKSHCWLFLHSSSSLFAFIPL